MHRKDDVRKCLHFSIEFANLFYIKLCTKIYTLIKWIEMNNGLWVSGMYTYVDFINFLGLTLLENKNTNEIWQRQKTMDRFNAQETIPMAKTSIKV